MPSYAKRTTAVLLVALLVASGVAGATVGGIATEGDLTRSVTDVETSEHQIEQGGHQTESSAHQTEPGAHQTGVDAQEDDAVTTDSLSCAETPPSDVEDPESDVLGWENDYWYNESLDVDTSDGIQQDERQAIISRTMARVEAVRCIEFEESVPVSVISREEFRDEQIERDVADDLRAFDNGKFESLFLVDESADSIEVQNRNRATGILGYYDPEQDEIVVISEDPNDLRIDELTLAHELVHAWQDQQYNLSTNPFDIRLRDRANAVDGLVEGDASYTDTLYERQCGDSWECLDVPPRGEVGDLANIGVYLMKFQPYSDGPAFVRMVRNVGGWDAVNDLYENPPESTEQVIHPLRYQSDPPTEVMLNDTATGEWERVRADDRPEYGQLGEAAVMMLFIYPYYDSQGQTEIVPPDEWFAYNETGNISDFDPLNYESVYSDGWDGDRLHVYENESGEQGYVWQLAWDSPQDAQQFVDGYEQVLRYWGGEEIGPNTWRIDDGGFADAFYVNINETTVTIVNAPTVGQLSEISADADPVVSSEVAEEGDEAAEQGDEAAEEGDEAADEETETTTEA